jgi:hypothetical protein
MKIYTAIYVMLLLLGNFIVYCTDNPVLTKRLSGGASVAD